MKRVIKAAKILISLSGLAMMIQITADVLARVLFDSSIEGTSVIVPNFYMITLVFGGIGVVSLMDGHIRVDLVVDRMRGRARRWVNIVAEFVSFGFLLVLAYALGVQAVNSLESEERVDALFGLVAIWPMRWLAFAGILVAAICAAWYGFRLMRAGRENKG